MRKGLQYSFSAIGLVLGTLFFAVSLTPTLLPRNFWTQGLVSGLSLAVGYCVGVFGQWLWTYLELPQVKGRSLHGARLVAATGCTIVAAVFLWRAADWQNSVRELMGMEPVETAHPIEVALIALAIFSMALALARLFLLTFRTVTKRVGRFVPRRVSNVIGITAAIALFWSVTSGILFSVALRMADVSYLELDRLIEPETPPPTDPRKTGSSASLLSWDELGRQGRRFISMGPSREDISAFSGRAADEPIRVYVGLGSAATAERRAKLALQELKRVGGFERPVLIVVTPTGTGWIDAAAMDTVEYLHDGAVASVALQYSYLASWLTTLVDRDYGADSARALFREVYGYWTTLPRASRPRLYLHGLSLGAANSQESTDLMEVIGDPFDGALWSGPPYSSRLWRSITANRNPGSPAWLPRFRDGSFVRFMNQNGEAGGPDAEAQAAWGPMRMVYLQYASDPVTFFEYRSLYREPDWMKPPRGPDVSPQLRWYPLVTFLQLIPDVVLANTAPVGYGHVFAPAHYLDAWSQVTGVRDRSPEEIARLKQHLSTR